MKNLKSKSFNNIIAKKIWMMVTNLQFLAEIHLLLWSLTNWCDEIEILDGELVIQIVWWCFCIWLFSLTPIKFFYLAFFLLLLFFLAFLCLEFCVAVIVIFWILTGHRLGGEEPSKKGFLQEALTLLVQSSNWHCTHCCLIWVNEWFGTY